MKNMPVTFAWKELPKATRTEITDINEGIETSYCRACSVVLKTTVTNGFCSSECWKQICPCGETKSEKLVGDRDATELLINRLGEFNQLSKMAEPAAYETAIERWQVIQDRPVAQEVEEGQDWDTLTYGPRDRENCCKRIRTGFITPNPPWCKPCSHEFGHTCVVYRLAFDLRTGKRKWPHVRVAQQILKDRSAVPYVMVKKLFCATCHPI